MRFSFDSIRQFPWATALEREFDLVIAANVLEKMKAGTTLYNDVLNLRIAERCAPLDLGARNVFLGVIDVPPCEQEFQHQRMAPVLADLAKHPRGTWAVLRMDGGYDAYMSDGIGGTATAGGNKFRYSRPDAPNLNFQALYGDVLSMASYLRRQEIEAAIRKASFEAHTVAVGTEVHDKYLAQKRWTRVTYLADAVPDHPGKLLVEGRRRGVAATKIAITPEGFLSLFDVPLMMPPEYDDPDNGARLRTLEERRIDAANNALTVELDTNPVPGIGRRTWPGYWRMTGDTIECPIYLAADKPGEPSGRYSVEFNPGNVEIRATLIRMDGEYELRPCYNP
jgi:hypothetical protein